MDGRTHLGDDGGLAAAGVAMQHEWAWRGGVQARSHGVERGVATAQGSAAPAAHRQVLVDLEHLRVERHLRADCLYTGISSGPYAR